MSRDVRQAIAGCASLTSAFGPLRHHLLIGRLQPFAYAWAGSTLRFQAEMDLAQLVHQLGHMVGPPSLSSGFHVGGRTEWPDLVKSVEALYDGRIEKLLERLKQKTGHDWALQEGPPPEDLEDSAAPVQSNRRP